MPDWILYNDLMEYFFYFKNKTTHNFTIEMHKLLKISLYFTNNDLIRDIIYKEVIPKLKNNNSIRFLESSYEQLSSSAQDVDPVWFDLFVSSLEHVSRNFLMHLNMNFKALSNVNNLLLEEIIEKFLCSLTKDLSELLSEDGHHNFFEFLINTRKAKDIFDLLTQEYERLCSDTNIKESILYIPPCIVEEINFGAKKDIMKEVKMNLFSQDIVFNIQYIYLEDLLKISFKIKSISSEQKLMTLMSTISISEVENYNQISLKMCNLDNNSIKYNIFITQNFSKKMKELNVNNENTNKVTLKLSVKLCKIHTEIANYISKYYNKFYNLSSVDKFTKQILFTLFKRKNINSNNKDSNNMENNDNNNNKDNHNEMNEDIYVISLTNWFKLININTLYHFVNLI